MFYRIEKMSPKLEAADTTSAPSINQATPAPETSPDSCAVDPGIQPRSAPLIPPHPVGPKIPPEVWTKDPMVGEPVDPSTIEQMIERDKQLHANDPPAKRAPAKGGRCPPVPIS